MDIGEEGTGVFRKYGRQAAGDRGDHDEAQPLVDLAKANLAEHLSIGPDEITMQSVEAVEFPDTSLGVPEPGHMYAQVITPGSIIVLVAADTVYEYHGSGDHIVLVPDL